MTRNCLKREKKQHKKEIFVICLYFIASFIIAAAFAVFIRIIVVGGESMEPVLSKSDVLLVSAASLIDNSFEYGDLVVYRCPVTEVGENYYLVNRIIGLPRDEVEVRSGVVYINEVPLEKDYTNEEKIDFNMNKRYVQKNQIFVLSDNRSKSYGGNRYELNFISYEDIIGKVMFRLFPLKQFGTVE